MNINLSLKMSSMSSALSSVRQEHIIELPVADSISFCAAFTYKSNYEEGFCAMCMQLYKYLNLNYSGIIISKTKSSHIKGEKESDDNNI